MGYRYNHRDASCVNRRAKSNVVQDMSLDLLDRVPGSALRVQNKKCLRGPDAADATRVPIGAVSVPLMPSENILSNTGRKWLGTTTC
jgi:hypothetical protein